LAPKPYSAAVSKSVTPSVQRAQQQRLGRVLGEGGAP
jgi:hypothetical protein